MAAKGTEHPGAQHGSLRDYWNNPTPVTQQRRRTSPTGSSSNLSEHANPHPLQARVPPPTLDGITQAALPFTWYRGEEGSNETKAGDEPTPSLTHLQQRVEKRGIQTLSNAELLALVLRTGAGNETVVRRMHSLLTSYSVNDLLHVDFGEFCQQYGLSKPKAAQLQALLEVSQRLTHATQSERYQITSPQDAATLLMPEMAHLDHEEMRVLVLDTRNTVVVNKLLYQGTVNSSVLRAAEIFRLAITRNCPGVIIAHNHPSGDPSPSPEDISTTEQLAHAGKVLDVELVDHLIIGNHRFISLKERLRW